MAWRQVGLFSVDLSRAPLGKGSQGCVRKAKNNKTHITVAAKEIPCDIKFEKDEHYQRYIKQGLEKWGNLKHRNLVKYLDSGFAEGNLYIFMEYCSHRSLNDFVKYHHLSSFLATRFIREIAGAVEYLHKNDIVHGDIKPDNVLVKEDYESDLRVCLSDLGIVKEIPHTNQAAAATVSPTKAWMAPEVQGYTLHTAKTDVFSCGLLFHAIITYTGQNQHRILPLRGL